MHRLSLLGKVAGKGPLRAKPNLNDDRFAAPQGKLRGGSGDVAEHTQPPSRLPGQRRFSLRENEQRGGHVLEKHVGKTEEQLKQRLDDQPRLEAVSTFRDAPTAEKAISAALDKNRVAIDEWLKAPKEPLELLFEGTSSLGITLERGASSARFSSIARIILKPDTSGGFYVLTAYLK